MDKKVIVIVEPPCMSANREMQYMQSVESAYKRGTLAKEYPSAEVLSDTPSEVKIRFKR